MPASKAAAKRRSRRDKLKTAPIRTVKWKVCLGRDDDVYEELDDLITEYNRLCADVEEPPKAALTLQPRISELMLLITDESTVEGRFRKEPSLLRWEEFLAGFPPRVKKGWTAPDDDPEAQPEFEFPDSVLGFNPSLMYPAAVRKYMVDQMDDEEWDDFTPHIADGDWDRLGGQVVALNRRPTSVPKLPRGFMTTRSPGSG